MTIKNLNSMQTIHFDEMEQQLNRILLALGVEQYKAKRCAHIFTENTCDGVASHGLNRFPNFVADIKSGVIKIAEESELVSSFGTMEQWDGKQGIGLLNAEKAMQRATYLANKNGIGCVGLRNTNHWMRGGTYGLQAAKAGCIGICWTNTKALLPPWGATEKRIGNNPLVVCVPREDEPVLLDMAMSQFSNGKLEVLKRRGESLPLAGGYDLNGDLTTDPHAILESSRALPIGYWKGSGMAVMLDLMASLISGGDATHEVSQRETETCVSQVFLAIDIRSQMGAAIIDKRVNAIVNDLLDITPIDETAKVRYPGENMFATRKHNLKEGMPVESELWQSILDM